MTAPPFAERVEHARRLIAATRHQTPPVDVADQLGAAAKEARGLLNRVGDVWETVMPGTRRYDGNLDNPGEVELAARIVAAWSEAKFCPHLRRTPWQPATYQLPTRRVTCRRCVTQVVRPVVAANVCDLCQEPAEMFTPIAVQLGLALVLGDVGPCCPTGAPAEVSGR